MVRPLNDSYKLYYTDDRRNVTNYEDRIHEIGEFSTAEGLLAYLCHLRPLGISGTDYHLFKGSIRPLWEDAGNRKGGKLIVRTSKRGAGLTMAVFNTIVMAFCAGGFGESLDAEVCGIVARARGGGFSVCVWHRDAGNLETRALLQMKLREVLNIADPEFTFEHETHDGSLALVMRPSSASVK